MNNNKPICTICQTPLKELIYPILSQHQLSAYLLQQGINQKREFLLEAYREYGHLKCLVFFPNIKIIKEQYIYQQKLNVLDYVIFGLEEIQFFKKQQDLKQCATCDRLIKHKSAINCSFKDCPKTYHVECLINNKKRLYHQAGIIVVYCNEHFAHGKSNQLLQTLNWNQWDQFVIQNIQKLTLDRTHPHQQDNNTLASNEETSDRLDPLTSLQKIRPKPRAIPTINHLHRKYKSDQQSKSTTIQNPILNEYTFRPKEAFDIDYSTKKNEFHKKPTITINEEFQHQNVFQNINIKINYNIQLPHNNQYTNNIELNSQEENDIFQKYCHTSANLKQKSKHNDTNNEQQQSAIIRQVPQAVNANISLLQAQINQQIIEESKNKIKELTNDHQEIQQQRDRQNYLVKSQRNNPTLNTDHRTPKIHQKIDIKPQLPKAQKTKKPEPKKIQIVEVEKKITPQVPTNTKPQKETPKEKKISSQESQLQSTEAENTFKLMNYPDEESYTYDTITEWWDRVNQIYFQPATIDHIYNIWKLVGTKYDSDQEYFDMPNFSRLKTDQIRLLVNTKEESWQISEQAYFNRLATFDLGQRDDETNSNNTEATFTDKISIFPSSELALPLQNMDESDQVTIQLEGLQCLQLTQYEYDDFIQLQKCLKLRVDDELQLYEEYLKLDDLHEQNEILNQYVSQAQNSASEGANHILDRLRFIEVIKNFIQGFKWKQELKIKNKEKPDKQKEQQENEEEEKVFDTYCMICFNYHSDKKKLDQINYCVQCWSTFHQYCYDFDENKQKCDNCKKEGIQSNPKCILCLQSYDQLPLKKVENKYVHITCAMLLNQIQIKDLQFKLVHKEIDFSYLKVECFICNQREGYKIKCQMQSCNLQSHPLCAYLFGIRFNISSDQYYREITVDIDCPLHDTTVIDEQVYCDQIYFRWSGINYRDALNFQSQDEFYKAKVRNSDKFKRVLLRLEESQEYNSQSEIPIKKKQKIC